LLILKDDKFRIRAKYLKLVPIRAYMIAYFLPAIIALGIITSYEDIKIGKIRNKWVILALIYAFVVYSGLIVHSYFSVGINLPYLIELSTNFVFVVGVGFGLWYFGIWTAGDGKLFIAFSALLPLSVYSQGYQKWIPSSVLLINIFIPASIILICFMLFKTKMMDIKKASMAFLKQFFQPKQFVDSVIYLFAIYWVVGLLLSSVGLSNSYILKMILTIFVFSSLAKKLKNKAIYIMLMITLARFIVDKSVYSLSFLVDFLILLFIWRFLMGFLRGSVAKLGQEVFAKTIRVNKLKPGMILSEAIQKKEKLTKEELNDLKKLPDTRIIKHKKEYYIQRPKSSFELNNFIDEEAEGLTTEQIDKIRKMGIKKMKVCQTIPFASFMFLGVVLTIIANGNILILIYNLL